MGNQIEIRIYIYSLVFLLFLSCSNHTGESNMSPLITVINLQSAESTGDFESAKKFIDVDKVYSKQEESNTAEESWKQMVSFFNKLGEDNKFTSCFKYYKYNISEKIDNNNKAKVVFEALSKESQIKKITYNLTKKNNDWIVIRIDYDKR